MHNPTNATLVEAGTEQVRSSNGESVDINSHQIYPLSTARSMLSLSEDKIRQACRRNQLSLRRKPYSYHTDRPEDVKCWLYGITGTDLIVVANDSRSNPEWEVVSTEGEVNSLNN